MPKYERSLGGGATYHKLTGEVRTAEQNRDRAARNVANRKLRAARRAQQRMTRP